MKGLIASLLVIGLLSVVTLIGFSGVSSAPTVALASLALEFDAPALSQAADPKLGAAFAGDSQDRAATMFLLLFVTSLVGLYIAARHVRRRNGFHGEDAPPVSKSERPLDLEPGEAYLVTQGQTKALKVFTQELKKGHPGLCITRTYPDKLRGSWDLEGAKVYWLTNGQAEDRGAVNSLDDLAQKINAFISKQEKGAILLDGVEYLFVQNSFTEVMKLLQNLKDTMPASGAKLIIPIDLLALVERQRALLAREFRQI
jgi:hypothetical protein